MMIRVRSRDGLERVRISHQPATIEDLRSQIEVNLHVPFTQQTLSQDQKLLLARTTDQLLKFTDMSNPTTLLSSLKIEEGSVVYLSYPGERSISGAPTISPAGSFGRKMTMDDLIACQMRITRQDSPHCSSVSFDRAAANAFQLYMNDDLAFSVKRGGFMYGTVGNGGEVSVQFIYEPPQQGSESNLLLMRDPDEENLVEAIATGLGMQRVGFIFTQSLGQKVMDYTLSNAEVLQAAELHAQRDLLEWVTAVVKLEVNKDGGADVHFEAFQLSDVCIKLFKEEWIETENVEGLDPKLSRMKKDVVVGGKDTRDVDNDFFLVVVKISDHQGPLSSNFPIENRSHSVTTKDLKAHLDRTKNLPFVSRISDFHLLLLLARHLDVNADVPALAGYVCSQAPVPEGYQLLIESLANTS